MLRRNKWMLLLIISLLLTACSDKSEPEAPWKPEPLGAIDALSGKTAEEYFHDKGLFIGWNLGNQYDAAQGSNGSGFENGWVGAPVTKQLFVKVKEAGFNLIRLPVTWRNQMGTEPPYAVNTVYMARIVEVAEWAHEAGLAVIVNVHHDGATRKDNNGVITRNWLSPTLAAANNGADYDKITARYTALWEQIAEAFKDYGDWLIFEPFNELHDGNWGTNPPARELEIINEWNQLFTNIVRESGGNNAQRFLVVQPYCAKLSAARSSAFTLPTDTVEGKQIVSIHFYDPEDFALRGTESEWGTSADIRNSMTTPLTNLKTKFTSKGIPVIIGECGAVYQPYPSNPAKEDTAHANRVKYHTELCKTAKDFGLIPVYWDNGTLTGGEKFAIFDRATGEYKQHNNGKSKEVIDAMMKNIK